MKKVNTSIDLGSSFEKMKKATAELETNTSELLMGLIDSRQLLKRHNLTCEGYAEAYGLLASKVKMYLVRTSDLSTFDIDRMLAPIPNEKQGKM